MSLDDWKEKNWRALIHAIQHGKCILILGPDSAMEMVEGKPRPLTEILANQLAEDIDPLIKKNINTSNLAEVSQHYVMKKDLGRNELEVEVSAFYQKRQTLCSQFHRDLAALPFYLTITSSHDSMFYEALIQEKKEPVKVRYHFKRKYPPLLEVGTVEKPVLFYLYGTIDETDSLVLTENDLLDFLVAIISKNPLPDRVLSEINAKDKNFLFLGFGFKNWYQRILLHVLQDREKESRSFAMEKFTPHNVDELRSAVLFFQESSSKIHIFTNELNDFAKELRKRYKDCTGTPVFAPGIEQENSPTVFICHASEDKEFAADLYERLKQGGLSPWLDKENLRGGDQWDKVIKKAIKKEINYFLVLQSQSLSKKLVGYVNKEIVWAREQQMEFRFGIASPNFLLLMKSCPNSR